MEIKEGIEIEHKLTKEEVENLSEYVKDLSVGDDYYVTYTKGDIYDIFYFIEDNRIFANIFEDSIAQVVEDYKLNIGETQDSNGYYIEVPLEEEDYLEIAVDHLQEHYDDYRDLMIKELKETKFFDEKTGYFKLYYR